jgi:hypothetical protein
MFSRMSASLPRKNENIVSAIQFTIKCMAVASTRRNKLCGNKMKPVAEIRRQGKWYGSKGIKLGEP